jgi:hypothetical protein
LGVILAGVALELVLLLGIDYTPLGNKAFGTAPIGLGAWLFMLPFAILLLVCEEVRKWVGREWKRARKSRAPHPLAEAASSPFRVA